MSIAEFFHMGGYAFYVWSAYSVAFIVLALNVWVPRRHEQQVLRTLMRSAQRLKNGGAS